MVLKRGKTFTLITVSGLNGTQWCVEGEGSRGRRRGKGDGGEGERGGGEGEGRWRVRTRENQTPLDCAYYLLAESVMTS